ncbi:MAG: spore coat protein CotJB [Clostridium sp.]|nr:spore coat protein CotJB [Clostridium sp.]MCM1443738.1 spore coat protein CotJB [Candidatus Amulumruptor caecigallinarius]
MNPYNNNYFANTNKTAMSNTINAVNNNNFNKCNYIQQVSPSNLYDAYNGFVRGNMYPDLYNQYKISKPFDIEPMNEQAQMLTYVDAYSFAAHDINLYLDTHPEDRAMIELYNQYRIESDKMIKEYESKFGPLFVNSEATLACPWPWNESPWPWENK